MLFLTTKIEYNEEETNALKYDYNEQTIENF